MDKMEKGLVLILVVIALMFIGLIISSVYFTVQVNNGVFESDTSFCRNLNGIYLSGNSGRGLCVIDGLTYQITEENNCSPEFFNFNCKHKLNGFADKGFNVIGD